MIKAQNNRESRRFLGNFFDTFFGSLTVKSKIISLNSSVVGVFFFNESFGKMYTKNSFHTIHYLIRLVNMLDIQGVFFPTCHSEFNEASKFFK